MKESGMVIIILKVIMTIAFIESFLCVRFWSICFVVFFYAYLSKRLPNPGDSGSILGSKVQSLLEKEMASHSVFSPGKSHPGQKSLWAAVHGVIKSQT